MPDFWPTDLKEIDCTLPVALVMEQAELLAKHTGNVIRAEVVLDNRERNRFVYDFDLDVSILRYRFTLFRFEYDIDGYPVFFIPHYKIRKELGLERINTLQGEIFAIKADDSDSLMEALGKILGSNATQRILRTLIGQAKQSKSNK